jgi:Squalene-hopene cyclase C-terminal domain
MATSTDLRSAIEEVQSQIPDEQLELDGLEGAYEADYATSLQERVGALPWWVVSAVVHSVIFLLCTLIGVALPPPNMDEVTITTDMARKEEPKYDQKKKRDVFKNPQDVKAENQVENPVVVHEQTEVTDHFETENEMDNQNARGSEDAISDIPLGGTGVTGSMGVGGGGLAGVYGFRDGGGRKKAVARFGGSKATESAVEAALRWLAKHQHPDGSWRCAGFSKQCQGGQCTMPGHKSYTAGVTGLATLAFVGAGYTQKTGKYRDNVKRALKWMVSKQEKNGRLGTTRVPYWTYNHLIPALALTETYAMTKDPSLKQPSQKAVDYMLKLQSPYSGWGHNYGTRFGADNGADVTGTAWGIQVMKAAKIGGLRVDGKGWNGSRALLDKVTRKVKGTGSNEIWACGYKTATQANPRATVRNACGLLGYLYMGDKTGVRHIDGLCRGLVQNPPQWNPKFGPRSHPKSSGQNMYGWYYGSMALFQVGGTYWRQWNGAMKKCLVENQRKGGCADGSWDPLFLWGNGYSPRKMGGRVYSTAICALTLEVYYRYLPSAQH